MKIPKFVYHATPKSRFGSILNNGLDPKYSCDGMVYLADTEQHAAGFVAMRMVFCDGEEIVETAVGPVKKPIMKPIKEIYVLKIATKKLDESKFSISYDHNPEFFEGDAYCYSALIPPHSICDVKIYELDPQTITL